MKIIVFSIMAYFCTAKAHTVERSEIGHYLGGGCEENEGDFSTYVAITENELKVNILNFLAFTAEKDEIFIVYQGDEIWGSGICEKEQCRLSNDKMDYILNLNFMSEHIELILTWFTKTVKFKLFKI